MSALEERVAEALWATGLCAADAEPAFLDHLARSILAAVYDELTRPGPTRDAMVDVAAVVYAREVWPGTGDGDEQDRTEMAHALDAALAVVFADDTQEQP